MQALSYSRREDRIVDTTTRCPLTRPGWATWAAAVFLIGAVGPLAGETIEDPDPEQVLCFSSGRYHQIYADAAKQLRSDKPGAALAYYRMGYVFELGLGRLVPALAHYYAGLQELERSGPDPQAERLLDAAINRALQTAYEQIEQPVAIELSVLVKGRTEILVPGKDISVGRVPPVDTRLPLTPAALPLDRKWVHVHVENPLESPDKLVVSERGQKLLRGYREPEFRVRASDVIRFFAEKSSPPQPDTAAVMAGCANFARRYPRSPLASWARRRLKELEGGVGPGVPEELRDLAVADVDTDIPRTDAVNQDAVAVVIGNRNYSEYNPDVPDVDFAQHDAAVMKQYLTRTLGYQEGNILYYENATNSVFRSVFGTRETATGRLAHLVKPGLSDVFIFYSGHGAPDVTEQEGYFVPVDCAPDDVRLNGYSLGLFYGNLRQVEARSFTVVIDACFSGGSPQGMLISSASPVGIRVTNPALTLKNAAVFTSSSGDEVSSWYPEMGHGLFTYFFLKGLQGAADADEDGAISTGELHAYAADGTGGVPYMARRLYGGRAQTPNFFGDREQVLLRPPPQTEENK